MGGTQRFDRSAFTALENVELICARIRVEGTTEHKTLRNHHPHHGHHHYHHIITIIIIVIGIIIITIIIVLITIIIGIIIH
jgi:hypothetical protein